MPALPQPLPDLASLDLFVSVGQLGSINAAAAAHGITQPAASMRLRSLERVLGLRLLDRTPSGSRLTPAGEATVEWAAAVIDEVRALLAGAAALRSGTAPLVIGASMTVAEYVMPQWLERVASEAPGLGVSLRMGNTAQVADMVREGAVEIGFIEGPHPPGRLRSRDLLDDDLVVVVGHGHPWARRQRPLDAAELASTPLLLREQGSGTRDVLTVALAEGGREPTVLMELGSTTAIKAAVVAGGGPAVLSALAVRPELRAGHLVAVPCSGIRLTRTIRAVWRTGPRLSPGAKQLLEIARTPGAPARSGHDA